MVRAVLSFSILSSWFLHALLIAGEKVSHEYVLESIDPIIYEDDNTTISASNNVSLRGNNFLLLADKITMNRKSGETIAKGSVSLTKENTRILADEIKLSTISGDFIATNTRGGTYPSFFTSGVLERNASVETYRNNRLYMSEPGMLEPNLTTKLYSSDENSSTITIAPSIVRVGNIIVGILPPFRGKERSGLWGMNTMIQFGKNTNLGWYGETGLSYRWDDLTASTKMVYYHERGTWFSPRLAYSKSWNDGFIRSTLNGGWIDDKINNRGVDTRGYTVPSQRSFTHFKSTWRFKEKWRSSTILEWESDSEIIRDFRRNHFYRNQWNQNHNEISYEGNGYTISMLSRWQANDHESRIEQLPLLSFDSGPNPMPVSNFYHSGTINFSKLIKRDRLGVKESFADRLYLGYKIERPLRLVDGITMTPSVAFLIEDYNLPENSFSRSYNEFGLDIHASMYQAIPYQNRTWEISQLTHLMRFSTGFRFSEMLTGNPLNPLPNFYSQMDDLNLDPLDILDFRGSERVDDRKLIRFGWENNILVKWEEKSRELLSMRSYYDMNFENSNATESGDFLYSEISIHPIYWLSLNLKNKIDLRSGKNYRQSYGINLRDGRFQGASFSYLSYLDFNDYSYLSAWKRLNEKLHSSVSVLYDLDKNYVTYWRGRLEYRTRGSWIWDFSVNQRKGTRKENNTEWSIGLSLGGFERNRLAEADRIESIYSM